MDTQADQTVWMFRLIRQLWMLILSDSVDSQTCNQEVEGLTPTGSTILSWRFDQEIFSAIILFLQLIQEKQLSVSGKRMSTILVNSLEPA